MQHCDPSNDFAICCKKLKDFFVVADNICEHAKHIFATRFFLFFFFSFFLPVEMAKLC